MLIKYTFNDKKVVLERNAETNKLVLRIGNEEFIVRCSDDVAVLCCKLLLNKS